MTWIRGYKQKNQKQKRKQKQEERNTNKQAKNSLFAKLQFIGSKKLGNENSEAALSTT